MAIPASRFIADLGPKKPAAQPAPEPSKLFNKHETKTNPLERIAEVEAKAFEEGKAAAQEEWSRKLDEQRAYYEKQLSIERLTWASREADRLTEQLSTAVQEVGTRIADTAAELLKPFLTTVGHQRAIGDLVKAIETILMKDEAITLEIAGPEDLLQLLREKLSGKNMALLFTPAEGPEVRVVAGQTILETQLGAWVAKVEEALR
jgi:hypothetical protein